eukprot:symbB.v1.2.022779.t1/scaffold2060.1/size90856/1
MVVLFFRDEEGVVKCLDIAIDQVHDLVGMMQAEGCVPSTAQLTTMTKQQLRELLSGLGLRMTNFERATKATVAQNIVDNWSRLQTRASDVASSSAPSTGLGYNAVEDNAPKFKHGGLPSGYGLLIDKIDPTTKGFQVFYMQGKLHITTDFGCRQVCDDDEEEETEREWMMKHNFVLLGRKDWMEDNGLDELTPRTSDPNQSDTNTDNDNEHEEDKGIKDAGKTLEDEDSTSNDEHETQPTWTDQDQKTLEILERLNEGAVKLNYHELLDMRAKKDKFFAQQMSENYDMDFLDFIGITVDEWEQYAKAPNDFFENAFTVEVFDNSGDTLLLKLEADKGATDAKTFKEYIYHRVENIKKSKGEEVAFGISDFNIARGAMNYLPYKDYDIIDGNKVFINLKLRGGVRGLPVQKTVAKKKNQSVPVSTTRDDATVFQNAFTCALNISTLTGNITLSMLLDYLTVVQMQTLLEKLKHGKENTAIKVESFAEMSPAWKQLEQAEAKIASAKNALKQTLFDDVAKVCTVDGKFKKSELVKKLEIAIAVREKSIAPSDVLMSEGAS